MSYGYIYKTTNMTNGKIYIGQHKGPFDRSYLGSGVVISSAIKKYGEGSFKVEPISYAESMWELNAVERFYISEFRKILLPNMIYNIADGGDGGNTFKDTPEGRKRMSDTAKKRKHAWNKGLRKEQHPSLMKMANTKQGRPAHNKGKPASEEQKKKQSLAMKGRHSSPGTEFKVRERI